MAGEIHIVSPERIAMEMRRLLADPNRAVGVQLMLETTLAKEILPEIVPHDESRQRRIDDTLAVLQRLGEPCDFPLALAALLRPFVNAEGADAVCGRWRLSNKETERVGWLVENHAALADARSMRWSAIQPFLIADGIDDLLRWMEAVSSSMAETAAYCRMLMARPREQLDPPPLLTGNDLLEQGIPSGPQYKTLLQRIRTAQLDGEVFDRSTALAMVEMWLNREERGEGRGERA
jgi:tRNA nucleotidyltransferase/poly(A) polymerase